MRYPPVHLALIVLAWLALHLASPTAQAQQDAAPPPDQTASENPQLPSPEVAPPADEGEQTGDALERDIPEIDETDFGQALLRMVLVLAGVLLLLIVLARWLPRWMGHSALTGRGKRMRVVDHLRLEPGKTVYLLQIDEQFVLVGASSAGIHRIADEALDHQALRRQFDPDAPPEDSAAASGIAPGAGGSGGPQTRPFASLLRPEESSHFSASDPRRQEEDQTP